MRLKILHKILNKKNIITFIIFFIIFILPVISMMNCHGWNEGSMEVTECSINLWIVREYANFYYDFVLVGAFAMGIPIIIYIVLGITIILIFRNLI
ncbi:hypothetical protein QPK13_07115 [Photorhabdus tasmaniensis]